MVRVFSSTLFLVTLATFGLAFSLLKRDIVQVEEDLAAIEKQVTALDNAVNSFSSTSTLPDALVELPLSKPTVLADLKNDARRLFIMTLSL